MSLQTSRIPLLFFFLLILASCEKPSDIGLDLPGQHALGTSYDKSRTIQASTIVQADSTVAFKSNPVLVGKSSDGDLGTISATHYTEVGLNGTAVQFNVNAGAQADSLVLVMAYTGYYYGDTTTNITLTVNKLAENFEDAKTYFTNTPLTLGDQLGTLTFKPKFNRTKKVVKVGDATQTVTFSRLVHIPLSKTFANELLGKSGTADFSSQEIFRQFWKGIAISASTGNSIVGFTPIPDSAGVQLGKVGGINLYFHDKNNKLQYHNFALSGSYYYNGITGNRSGVLNLKSGQEVLSTTTNNITYIQENTGVKTRITFPDLANLKLQEGNIYVNHAELILPVKAGTINNNGKVANAPNAVFLYESTAGKRVNKTTGGVSYAVQQGNTSPFGLNSPTRALLVADSGFYKANVTSYIQALLDKRKPDNGIIISPQAEDKFTATAAGVSFPGTVTANRALLDPTKMQLRIYYSKIN